jgi:hypothetical protein
MIDLPMRCFFDASMLRSPMGGSADAGVSRCMCRRGGPLSMHASVDAKINPEKESPE